MMKHVPSTKVIIRTLCFILIYNEMLKRLPYSLVVVKADNAEQTTDQFGSGVGSAVDTIEETLTSLNPQQSTHLTEFPTIITSLRRLTSEPTTISTTPPPTRALFPHGNGAGDQRMAKGDDNYSPEITPAITIFVGNMEMDKIIISTNGYVCNGYTNNRQRLSDVPRRFNANFPEQGQIVFAPFWSDIDTTYNDGQVFYHIYEKYTVDGQKYTGFRLNEIKNLIRDIANIEFDPIWAMVVTWKKVRPYNSIKSTETNTFQLLLIANRERSILIYMYEWNGLNWDHYRLAMAGYKAGRFFNHRNSMKSTIFDIDKLPGPRTKAEYLGIWVVDLQNSAWPRPNYKLQCLQWYQNQISDGLLNKPNFLETTPCPCTLLQAFFDRRFVWLWGTNCFVSRFNNWLTGGRKCCYLMWGWNPLIFGHVIRYNPFWSNFFLYGMEEALPFENCCRFSPYCSLFTNVRQRDYCFSYRFPIRAFLFGDPHIKTLDGLFYTFNGWGEYLLLNVTKRSNSQSVLEIHARTSPATDATGNQTNATVFTAFAAKDENNVAQVELSDSKDKLIILVNGADYTLEFYSKANFSKRISDMYLQRESTGDRKNQSVSVIFKSGLSINVSVAIKMLEISVSIPEEQKSNITTNGLLGTYDDDKDNDLMTPNGTVLSPNSSHEDIFYNFGQLWKLKETFFKYPPGRNSSFYERSDFVPTFYEINENSAEYQDAREKCGDNYPCIYDYIVTRDLAVANSSKKVQNDAVKELKASKNFAPGINGTKEIEIIVNETKSLILGVTDKDDDDKLTVASLGSPDAYSVSFNQGSGLANISVTPNDTKPFKVSLIAIDDMNATSASFEIKVRLCSGCAHHGVCDFNNSIAPRQSSEAFDLVACICYPGWTGLDCETDIDGCFFHPCPEGANCTDVPGDQQTANGTAFDCTCPDGYIKRNSRCLDINECSNQTDSCNQTCINTDGSYRCACKDGYKLVDKYKCQNIDECKLNLHNCEQNCKDTIGNFTCSCNLGHKLNSDGFSCNKTEDICSQNKNCDNAHGCTNGTTGLECFCRIGYTLEPNNRCADINECENFPCEQRCTNNNGSFTCSCLSGFTLAPNRRNCTECDVRHWGIDCKNECSVCGPNTEKCDNIYGCECADGWMGQMCEDDVNECIERADVCEADELCNNKIGSYQCVCKDGYEYINNTCTDIDECARNNVIMCTHKCENQPGSFLCVCSTGYQGDGTNCTNINECELKTDTCEQICNDREGFYDCTCYDGYKLDDDRRKCNKIPDVKLCNITELQCDHLCTKKNGVAQCECKRGYDLISPENKTCKAKDPCQSHPCTNGECHNTTDNKFFCTCQNGFELDNTQIACKECDSFHWGLNCNRSCKCANGKCNRSHGCVCDDGWSGTYCSKDIDECRNASICDSLKECTNLIGNYTCTCLAGYQDINGTCTDCPKGFWSKNCAKKCACLYGECNNVRGCICHNGWNGSFCNQDINECDIGNFSCRNNSVCRNTPGRYECDCLKNYEDVNDECVPIATSTESTYTAMTTETSSAIATSTESTYTAMTTETSSGKNITAIIYFNLTLPSDKNEREALRKKIETALNNLYINLGNFLKVTVQKLKNGSTIAFHDIYFKIPVEREQYKKVHSILNEMYENVTISIDNQTVGFSRIPELFYPNNSNPVSVTCKICSKTYPEKREDKCYCKENDSQSPPTNILPLILGLSIGIPLFILFILLMVVFYFYRRKKGGIISHPDSDPYSVRQGFGSSSISRYLTRRYSSSLLGNYKLYWGEDDGEDRRVDGTGMRNFSWNFLHNYVDDNEKFEIRRPKLNK